jgi:citrate lyase beta subunit
VRHFAFLSSGQRDRIFHRPPQPFCRSSGNELLSVALGATLYLPATRPALATDVARQHAAGVVSMVACLEDSISAGRVPAAETNIVDALHTVHHTPPDEPPLLFVRVRRPEQIIDLAERLGPAIATLAGFVLPKFTAASGVNYLDACDHADHIAGTTLLAMPVLESPELLYAESRLSELSELASLLDKHRQRILAIRLGATDLSALYGLRRSRELTVYDVRVVADLISDVVNVFGRVDGSGFTVTGPVWEYFTGSERLFKPQLRTSPFDEHNAAALRRLLVSRDGDGLIREVELDKANGLIGKTVIHPSHVAVVHALSVVSLEEYQDACDILDTYQIGGVLASGYRNKMNEIGPHRAWARRILRRADVFGVAAERVSFIDLLAASLSQ